MEAVIISKEKLLTKLRDNRKKHRAIFEDALRGWEHQVLTALQKAVEDAKEGRKYTTFINLPRPSDHTNDYDEVIDRVEWHEDSEIELSLRDFKNFVRDDWDWSEDFSSSSSSYSMSSSISSRSPAVTGIDND